MDNYEEDKEYLRELLERFESVSGDALKALPGKVDIPFSIVVSWKILSTTISVNQN